MKAPKLMHWVKFGIESSFQLDKFESQFGLQQNNSPSTQRNGIQKISERLKTLVLINLSDLIR